MIDTGIILEYEQGGFLKTKSIDLLDLRPEYVLLCLWCLYLFCMKTKIVQLIGYQKEIIAVCVV